MCVTRVVSVLFARIYIQTVNTEHFFVVNLKQLHVSAVQGTHHQPIYFRNVKGDTYIAVDFKELTKGSLSLTVCVCVCVCVRFTSVLTCYIRLQYVGLKTYRTYLLTYLLT